MRFFVSAISLFALLFAPNVSGTFLGFMERSISRIVTPVTDQEKSELDFLNCIYKVSEAIPQRSNVRLFVGEDSYLQQRSRELLYPRVRVVDTDSEYEFYVGIQPSNGTAIASDNCGGLVITAVESD